MTTIKKVNESLNEELKELYQRILEILEEPNLNEDNIENELENLEKTLDDFMKEILDLEPFKAERNEIRNFIIVAQELRIDKDLVDKILYIAKKSKLEKKIKKLFIDQLKDFKENRERNRRVLLKIDNTEESRQLFTSINNFWVIKPLLERNQDQNYLERLQRIFRAYRYTNNRLVEVLYDLIPFWKKIATKEVKKTFIGNLSNLEFLQSSIDVYTNYLKMDIVSELELSEIYENCLKKLYQTDSHLQYELRLIKTKITEDEDWIENYTKILKMFKKAKRGRYFYIKEEKKALKAIFAKLTEEMREKLKTTRRAGYVYAKRILKLTKKYNGIYNFSKLSTWAHETKDKYCYLIRK